MQIFLSPLYVLRSHLPLPLHVKLLTPRTKQHQVLEVEGQGQEYQLHCSGGDVTHQLSFQLGSASVFSPAVPCMSACCLCIPAGQSMCVCVSSCCLCIPAGQSVCVCVFVYMLFVYSCRTISVCVCVCLHAVCVFLQDSQCVCVFMLFVYSCRTVNVCVCVCVFMLFMYSCRTVNVCV